MHDPQLSLILAICLGISLGLLIWLLVRMRKLQREIRLGTGRHVAKKELFYQLVDLMPDWIYIKDQESRFIFANRHMASYLGVSDPRKMKGKTDFDYYPEELARGFYEDERRILQSGDSIVNQEEIVRSGQGEESILSTTKMPLTDRSGRIIGIAGIGRNITRQKDDQLRLNELSVVASATDNVVVIMDAEGNFKWVNHCFEKRYDCSMEEFVQNHGINLKKNSSNAQIEEILEEVHESRKAYTYTTRTRDKDGQDMWYQTHITPILDAKEKVSSLFLIDVDITSIKKADLQIKQQKYELEYQRDQLRKLNASKDKLFSIIAHDLKNPFQAIIGFAELLREDFDELEPQQVQEYLGFIHQSSTSAYDLLFNLLEWARAQTRTVKIRSEAVNIRKLSGEVLDLLCAQAQNKGIELQNECGGEIVASVDGDMLHTILRNLVGNAIKYTLEGGSISIRARQKEEQVEISIKDTGLGMSEEKIRTLFSMDKKVSTPGTSGEKGTGLGLLVCYEFLTLNKGSIHVESQEGKGSTFTISLPIVN